MKTDGSRTIPQAYFLMIESHSSPTIELEFAIRISFLIRMEVGAQKDFESFLDSLAIDRSARESPGFNLKEKSRQAKI
ncbi:hypothetical protein PGT21_006082 [Puccinia graminis f. sp. tritici]|uniref:Uncharacterized protein n=1 Tax=Puccinia graminis f. sp. tritici TaxID=56615 RepID=A0A5B0M9C7_PUCGR|nr:hypothetical protein PGTUg99_022651 [Puccinia graminis f. sp. tritici]KAA1074461.1 hypothetical protein PGT21_006082 [Puccinia graminis f. sp. tritici]